MIIFNPADGSIVEANKASEKLYGWNAEEFKKIKISDISQMEDPKVTMTHSTKEDLQEPIHRVLKHRISSGDLRDVEITSTPILMNNKTLIIMIIHDITERRKIENKLRLAESVFINSHGGILIADSQSKVIDVSPSFTKITGYSRSEIIGKTPKVLSSGKHPPEFYRDMWESLKKNDFWSGEVWNRRKNGEIYPENLSISAIRNSENQIQHYLGFFSDITTSKLHESSLIEARKLAESATLAKSRFLATMSHEIRTPMNGILGMAQLLTMPEISDDERKQFAKTILNSGNVLLTLLNDILDLSKVEAGKVEIEKLEIYPFDILLETKTLYEEIAKDKKLSIAIHWMGDKNQSYISDPHRIRQMLSNLVSNAIKFTQNGKIKLEAREIIEDDKPLKIEFSVTDTGIGIPQNKLTKLFEPFSQVESSTTRKYGGTGLGLSIVSGLSKLMGGNFGVSSQVNKGSCFWFNIAVEESHSHKRQSTNIHQNNNQSVHSSNTNPQLLNSEPFNLNLLIVDDDPVNRIVIENFTKKLKIKADITENGHQALSKIFERIPYDLVLMDIQMPIMDGISTTLQIRKWEQENRLKPYRIIAFTADAFEETKKNCIENGMNGIITKPISMIQFQELLKEVEKEKLESLSENLNFKKIV